MVAVEKGENINNYKSQLCEVIISTVYTSHIAWVAITMKVKTVIYQRKTSHLPLYTSLTTKKILAITLSSWCECRQRRSVANLGTTVFLFLPAPWRITAILFSVYCLWYFYLRRWFYFLFFIVKHNLNRKWYITIVHESNSKVSFVSIFTIPSSFLKISFIILFFFYPYCILKAS